jgi:hypothetical protein
MRSRIGNRNPVLLDCTVGSDQSRRANRPFRDFALSVFPRTPCAVQFHSFLLRVGEQNKREIEFTDELIVRVDTIRADTHNDGIGFCYCVDSVAEPARLFGSTRGIVFGIEPQNYVFTRVIRQRMLFAVASR